jgi:hypothetical protein
MFSNNTLYRFLDKLLADYWNPAGLLPAEVVPVLEV